MYVKGVPFFNKRYFKVAPFLQKWYIKGKGLDLHVQTDRHVFIWGLIQRKYIDYNSK